VRRDVLRPVACDDDEIDEQNKKPPLTKPPICSTSALERLF
jgi:hypothetical protein